MLDQLSSNQNTDFYFNGDESQSFHPYRLAKVIETPLHSVLRCMLVSKASGSFQGNDFSYLTL